MKKVILMLLSIAFWLLVIFLVSGGVLSLVYGSLKDAIFFPVLAVLAIIGRRAFIDNLKKSDAAQARNDLADKEQADI